MATPFAIALFLGSLAVTLAAAAFFADRLDHLAPRLGFPEAIVGLLTAIAADAPEISSAVVALARGEKNVGIGVVVGSCAFNVATMLGVSALVAGAVAIGRRTLAVEAVVGLTAAAAAAGVVFGAVPPWVALAAFGAVAIPYVAHVWRRPVPRAPHAHHEGAVWKPAALIAPAVLLIVLGSTGLVRAAIVLSDRWHVSRAITGFLILAALTSLPNAFTAIRLGLAGRGEAVVAETLASNTINLVGGVVLPALAVGLGVSSGLARFDAAWVVALTAVAVLLLAVRIGPRGGALLVASYGAFVAVQLAYS